MRTFASLPKRIAALVALLVILASGTTGAAAAGNLHSGALDVAAAGNTCTVGASGATYTRIKDAVNDPSCAIINIAAGTYQENVTIGRDVTINGAGASSTIADAGNNSCQTLNECSMFVINKPVAVTISGLTIRNGYNQSGGGVQITASANVTIQNSIVTNNRAAFPGNGGGINFGASGGTLTVNNTSFAGNSAGGSGAAINLDGGTLTVLTSSFSGNGGLSQHGGAINTSGPTTIKNSTFAGNRGAGGALWLQNSLTTIINSTFANNQGDGYYGGAIYMPNGGTLNISSSTLVGNNAGYGGGIAFQGGQVTLKSTILANNTAGISGGNCYRTGGDLRNGGNNLRWPSSDSSCLGSFRDPKLGALADNGSGLQTMAPQPGSGAIDTGICTDISGVAITTDERGQPRPTSKCDIGAFEGIPGNVAYWKLDEGTGTTTLDWSGSGKNGTITQLSSTISPWSNNHAPTVFSNPWALYAGAGVSRISAPLVSTQTDNVSLSAWVWWNGGTGSGQVIVYNGNTASSGYGIFIGGNNHVNLLAGGVAFYDFGYTLSTQSNAWTHIALVRSSGTWRLYVGGVQQGGTTGARPNTPTTGTYIGSNNGGNELFNGFVDDVRIYNRALSTSELRSLAAGNP